MQPRTILLWAGLLGAAGVITGALGAHALGPSLNERGMRGVWETAVQFHLLHAIALLALAGWLRHGLSPPASWAARCWIAGTICFSGSLYLLALGGGRWLGPITPLGGLLLLIGWICVAWTAAAPQREHER